MTEFLAALGLVCVIEGSVWVISPRLARKLAAAASAAPESTMRLLGMAATVLGLGLLWLVRR